MIIVVNTNKTGGIMIVGVGGQGTLLASRLLGNVLLRNGMDVKVSEVHGMSQRGGSVVTYVKYGCKVNSPVIEEGEADYILAFEKLEAARYLPYLKKDGLILANVQEIYPMPVITGAAEYPREIINKIRASGASVEEIDALKIAEDAGSAKIVNVVLIAFLAKRLPFNKQDWEIAVKETVPPKFLEQNLKALNMVWDVYNINM